MKMLLFVLLFLSDSVAFAQAQPQPYYFSDELKNAIKNCTPYTEELYEKNPSMKERATSMMRAFFDRFDLSEVKMFLSVQGFQEDNCQISIKYDYPLPVTPGYVCVLTQDAQDKLLTAMNDKSTEETEKTFENNGFSMMTTGRKFDLTLTEITGTYCKAVEHEPTEQEQAEIDQKTKETVHKMMAFSDKFKNSLKNCTPDRDTINVMGMEVNEVEIKGKEQDKCLITSHGFQILLNDSELSLSGFDELSELLADETRVTYSPSYKYQGILFALSECEQKRSYNQGEETLSLGDIKISQGISGLYETGVCQIILSLTINKNGKNEDYSLRCDVASETNISSYTKPYFALIQQYAPKVVMENGGIATYAGQQTDDVSAADKELFSKMYKDGICKKLNDFPPINSQGCSHLEPLMGWDDKCHSCEETEHIKLSIQNEEECERVCNGAHGRSKRIHRMTWDCALETCPKDKPLRGEWGDCYSCDFDGPLDDENCSLCPNRHVNKNGNCVITDCTNRPLVDENGVCYSCDTEKNISVETGKCTSVCPNRAERGSWNFGDKSGVFCSLKI